MATAIVVEDGTGVNDANSYVSVAALRTYASDRGVTLPADDSAVAILIFQAMDYFKAEYDDMWVGCKTNEDNALAWPRDNVCINGKEYADNAIPQEIIDAECVLAMAVNSKIALYVNTAAGQAAIKSESAGRNAVATEYFEPFYTAMVATIPLQRKLIAKFLRAKSLYLTRRV